MPAVNVGVAANETPPRAHDPTTAATANNKRPLRSRALTPRSLLDESVNLGDV